MNAIRTTQPAVELILESPGGARRSHRLGEEDQVLVGTSDHCGVQLNDETVANYHCVIGFENGSVWVQDWSSTSETLVNGQPINGKTEIGDKDQLRVGRYLIVPQWVATAPGDVSPEMLSTGDQSDTPTGGSGPDEPPLDSSLTFGDESEPAAGEAPLQPASSQSAPAADLLQKAPEEIPAEVDPWTGASGWQLDPSADFPLADDPFATDEMFDRETVELLRAEIEDLQAALAQRDAAASEAASGPAPSGPSPSTGQADENQQLLARLDQLLEEAERSDERIAVLEEMLESAEQVNQASQEERHQLQQWIGEIENRIGQREAEWKAEIESYQSQLADARDQRELLQKQLKQMAQRGGGIPQQYSDALEQLQQRNGELQAALTEANKQRACLKEKLEQGETLSDRALCEERAKIAQERAAVSRMRHELSSKLAALEEMPEPKNQPDGEFTGRLQALREHLREIHAQEKQEREERESTLTGRLARLWNRLES